MLCANHPQGLFAVGDDDQSIYSWRGGSPNYIRGFVSDFGQNARVIPLTLTHRCKKSILEAALCVVREDDKRTDKGAITYQSSEEGKVEIHNVPSDKREAQIIRAILEEMEPSETALVLIPTRRYLPLITRQLRIGRLEYTCPVPQPGEGLPILERLSAWIVDEKDSLALRECIEAALNNPSFGVPSRRSKSIRKVKDRLSAYAAVSELWVNVKKGESLWVSLEHASNDDELLRNMFSRLKMIRDLEKKDVQGFLSQAVDLLNPWATTRTFLEEIQAWVGTFEETGGSPSPRVRVMTYQGAKGLEADIVCVIGLEQGTLPKNDLSEEDLAEQRRLMFVSMTRAKKELHLFHARKRSGAVSFHGLKGPETMKPSAFIGAIDDGLVEKRWHPPAKR
jgi:superfamily I DNA/RNA helicase